MLILIHGDNIEVSRKKLDEFILERKNVNRFDGGKAALADIMQVLHGQELFASQKTIIIENFLALPKASLKEFYASLSPYVKDNAVEVILWEDDVVSATHLKSLKDAQVFLYALPKYYFNFLDGLKPKNASQLHQLLFTLYPASSDMQIFYGMVNRIRALLIVKTGKPQDFEETKKMSDWQLSKLSKQAQSWDLESLVLFYKQLFQLEKDMKTSNLPMQLVHHIDILLYNQLH